MITQFKEVQQEISLNIPSSAYIHIPFCRRRCYYCDFPVSIVGNRLQGDTSNTISEYVEMLCAEIAITQALGEPLQTVFFGGGTPSLLSSNQLDRILKVLDQKFAIAANAEVSIEMDPGTFDNIQLQGYLNSGVNRISLGVQAFEPELLQICGRSHTLTDIWTAVEIIKTCRVKHLSLDLISALPHQTLAQWQNSLETAIAIAPDHISIYDLTIEPKTVFGRYYQPGVQPLPNDETTVQMYKLGQKMLTSAGYEHYEISNYAQPGHQCRHNRVYWENRPYYGFGMGATSYTQGQRLTRPRQTQAYYQWVKDLIAADGGLNCPTTPLNEVLLETLMLGLRLKEGINLSNLAQLFGKDKVKQICECLQPYCRQGWVEFLGEDGKAIAHPNFIKLISSSTDISSIFRQVWLTDPDGFLFSNTILAALFSQLSVTE